MRKVTLSLLALGIALAGPSLAQQKIVQVKGSDTLVNLSQAWAERFTEKTGRMVAVTGGGSGTGIAALIDGKCDVAQPLWQKVVDTRMFSCFEFEMASRYLRLGAPSSPPGEHVTTETI